MSKHSKLLLGGCLELTHSPGFLPITVFLPCCCSHFPKFSYGTKSHSVIGVCRVNVTLCLPSAKLLIVTEPKCPPHSHRKFNSVWTVHHFPVWPAGGCSGEEDRGHPSACLLLTVSHTLTPRLHTQFIFSNAQITDICFHSATKRLQLQLSGPNCCRNNETLKSTEIIFFLLII